MRTMSFLAGAALMVSGSAQAHEVVHADHDHAHAADCGHDMIAHEGHVDFLHDGHMHSAHGTHADEHTVAVTDANPVAEGLIGQVEHMTHAHGADGEDHAMVQHGDHFDFIHDGELHHSHDDHVDNHGSVRVMPT